MGLSGSLADFWKRRSSQEGIPHKSQRQIAMAALSPDYVAARVPDFTRIAKTLLAGAARADGCDFITAFSESLPVGPSPCC